MALQVQNGYLVLLMDIGSGTSTVISDKQISDNKWYKATVERYLIETTNTLYIYMNFNISLLL